MHPTLFDLVTPWFSTQIRSFGLMLMIGFLGGVWWACRRAVRVKADPDVIINIALLGLIAAVVGARLFYVLHYWDRFAGKGLGAIADITQGGMEFYGCFIGAFLAAAGYLWFKRASFRLYMDIMAPSMAFGIAVGRVGCFLNGCCWGGVCPPAMPWGVHFPYASNAYIRQWEDRQLTAPSELIYVDSRGLNAYPLGYDALRLTPEQRDQARKIVDQARRKLQEALTAKADPAAVDRLRKELDEVRKNQGAAASTANLLTFQENKYGLTPQALRSLALSPEHRSLSVHPVQLYAAISAGLIAAVLNTWFYRRRHHGMVACLFWFMYPLTRVLEEIIRADNPHDTLGLTISQFVSLLLVPVGIIWYIVVRRLPPRAETAPAPGRG